MTQLVAGRDKHSTPTWVIEFPLTAENYGCVLTSGAEETVTVPAGKTVAVFSYTPGTTVFVAKGGSAISIYGSTFATNSAQVNPAARYVSAGETLRFRTEDTASYVNVTFYAN